MMFFVVWPKGPMWLVLKYLWVGIHFWVCKKGKNWVFVFANLDIVDVSLRLPLRLHDPSLSDHDRTECWIELPNLFIFCFFLPFNDWHFSNLKKSTSVQLFLMISRRSSMSTIADQYEWLRLRRRQFWKIKFQMKDIHWWRNYASKIF